MSSKTGGGRPLLEIPATKSFQDQIGVKEQRVMVGLLQVVCTAVCTKFFCGVIVF